VLAVVFPQTCPACRHPLDRPTRGPLCGTCWLSLPRHRRATCACGGASPTAGPCGRCRRGLSSIAAGASLGPYEGTLRTAIHELKYGGQRRVAARLAEAALQEAGVRALVEPGAVLVPVPLHPRRRRERGFNQSELLAREIARRTGACLAPAALVRRTDTRPQTGLSAAARRANVKGAFAVRQRARIAGRSIVLIDDVSTTGATAQACARALREAGAADVRLLTMARVS
jgi:ComF family protein